MDVTCTTAVSRVWADYGSTNADRMRVFDGIQKGGQISERSAGSGT
jgi:hypothetical protein